MGETLVCLHCSCCAEGKPNAENLSNADSRNACSHGAHGFCAMKLTAQELALVFSRTAVILLRQPPLRRTLRYRRIRWLRVRAPVLCRPTSRFDLPTVRERNPARCNRATAGSALPKSWNDPGAA